jgi:hypothetical protein
MTTFAYDSATWENIPRGAYALLYSDGNFTAPADADRFFRAVRRITVLGGESAAADAGAGDFEPGNDLMDVPGRLVEWVAARAQMGCLARVYCDRANAKDAWDQVGVRPNVRWWYSTLDGNPWSAENLAVNLHRDYGVPVKAELIWGCQNVGGETARFDSSLIYGRF